MKTLLKAATGFLFFLTFAGSAMAASSIDKLLPQQISSAPLALTPVVITYDHKPGSADFLQLKSLGISGGVVLDQLPMVLTAINKSQFDALRTRSGIVSLYANRMLRPMTNASRPFIGVTALMADREVTVRNNGMPVSGRNVGIAYVDTGIDATHPDLQLGKNVVQNVQFPLAEVPLNLPSDFVPIVAVENVPISDVEGGHGTFGAGVAAGTGQASGAFFGGIAPGAKLIGLVAGNDAGLSTFAIVQAYDYALVHQFQYNIRVCNNSFGTTLADTPYDPFDPINVATLKLHDRNITVVFAAGNDGDTAGAINPLSVAPWVISVAAGLKQGFGTPADFSSRGVDNGAGTDIAGQPGDPLAPPNFRPDMIGSGVDIKSARSKGPGITNAAGTLPIFVGANDLTTIPPAFLPFYTTSQGTSFSTPQVSGVVAMMMEANPLLTPDEVVTILRQTATPMPFEERVVGAGYVDAHNAVRVAMNLALVAHPANLFPQPGGPEIVDPANDELGTTAQDILNGDFAYDSASRQIVYTLTLADLSNRTPNDRWTMSSNFGATTIFVSTAITETGATTFKYGRITTLATGTRNQETLGDADFGEIKGNRILVRLSVDKINAAVGSDVVFTTSTATLANAQILIGTSLSGGLLLNSDTASGSDFKVGEPPAPDNTNNGAPAGVAKIEERLAGTMAAGESSVEIPVSIRLSTLDAKLNFHPGNQNVSLQLVDASSRIVATADQSDDKRIRLNGLLPGQYRYRISGSLTKAIDFVIKSKQETPEN